MLGTDKLNPKDRIGMTKMPLHLWPIAATIFGSMGLLPGELKYGRTNWREENIHASVYKDALDRHMAAWFEGEEVDPEDGVPHLAHALACLAIIVDAIMTGRFVDDRNYNGAGYRAFIDKFTPEIQRVKALYADRAPKHYDINDTYAQKEAICAPQRWED